MKPDFSISLVSLVDQLVGIINTAIPVLASFAVFFFLLNIVRYIYKAGDAGSKGAEKKGIWWGLVALFVIFSIWGLLYLFQTILFPTGDAGIGEGGYFLL